MSCEQFDIFTYDEKNVPKHLSMKEYLVPKGTEIALFEIDGRNGDVLKRHYLVEGVSGRTLSESTQLFTKECGCGCDDKLMGFYFIPGDGNGKYILYAVHEKDVITTHKKFKPKKKSGGDRGFFVSRVYK